MDFKDLPGFCRLMYEIGLLYRIRLSEQFCALYWQDLRLYSLKDIVKAWHEHRLDPKKSCFVPKPGDFIYYIKQAGAEKANQAWLELLNLLEKEGKMIGHCDDPIMCKVLAEIGGQWGLLRLSYRELEQKKNVFLARYQRQVEFHKKKSLVNL